METALQSSIRRRHMTRAFDPEPIPTSTLDDLLDRSRQAPSAGNTSATGFVVLDKPEQTARYWETTFSPEGRASFRWQQLFDAPALVIVTTQPEAYVQRYAEADKARAKLGSSTDGWGVPYWWVDSGAVVQNLLLLAQDAGYGACLFGLFDHEADVIAEFDLPTEVRLVGTIALGRPLPDQPGRSAQRQRPASAEIIHRPSAKS